MYIFVHFFLQIYTLCLHKSGHNSGLGDNNLDPYVDVKGSQISKNEYLVDSIFF